MCASPAPPSTSRSCELLSRRVHVQLVNVNGVDVRLSEPRKKEEEKKPFSLTPPIDLLLDSLALKDARISRDGKELFVVRAAEAAAKWTKRDGVVVQKLAVDSPDGNVHLTADVSGGDGLHRRASRNADPLSQTLGKYKARLTGGFRWKVADAQYVGELTATSEQRKLNAQVRLSEPFGARVDATVNETKELPWQLTLAVPQFDPRKGLLPDSSIESLATTLEAHGDLTFAELRGDVAMNGKSLRIDPARIRYQGTGSHHRDPDPPRPDSTRLAHREGRGAFLRMPLQYRPSSTPTSTSPGKTSSSRRNGSASHSARMAK